MDLVAQFFQKTNFDALIKQAVEKDIVYISERTEEAICGFGLCTNWTIDCSPSEFWLTSLLTEEGANDLDDEDMYATGSWDGFDQGSHSESSKITDSIYSEMWSVCKSYDDQDEFYERVRIRCAQILLSCTPLIKEKFVISDNFFVSIAEHDEEIEARERMLALVKA